MPLCCISLVNTVDSFVKMSSRTLCIVLQADEIKSKTESTREESLGLQWSQREVYTSTGDGVEAGAGRRGCGSRVGFGGKGE